MSRHDQRPIAAGFATRLPLDWPRADRGCYSETPGRRLEGGCDNCTHFDFLPVLDGVGSLTGRSALTPRASDNRWRSCRPSFSWSARRNSISRNRSSRTTTWPGATRSRFNGVSIEKWVLVPFGKNPRLGLDPGHFLEALRKILGWPALAGQYELYVLPGTPGFFCELLFRHDNSLLSVARMLQIVALCQQQIVAFFKKKSFDNSFFS